MSVKIIGVKYNGTGCVTQIDCTGKKVKTKYKIRMLITKYDVQHHIYKVNVKYCKYAKCDKDIKPQIYFINCSRCKVYKHALGNGTCTFCFDKNKFKLRFGYNTGCENKKTIGKFILDVDKKYFKCNHGCKCKTKCKTKCTSTCTNTSLITDLNTLTQDLDLETNTDTDTYTNTDTDTMCFKTHISIGTNSYLSTCPSIETLSSPPHCMFYNSVNNSYKHL